MRKALGLSLLAALLVVGTAAGIFTARGGASNSKLPTTNVTVVMTEYHFALSKQYAPVGTVVFKVVILLAATLSLFMSLEEIEKRSAA